MSDASRYKITGMSCAACQAHVEKAVSGLEGVTKCEVSLLTNSMSVEALAAALNGEKTQQSGAPAASNTAPAEPTAAMSGEPQGSEPAADRTVEGNEEA